jgi:hypothetical protein
MIANHPRPNVEGLVAKTEFVEIDPDSPEVDAIVTHFRERMKVGPRVRAAERGKRWIGAMLDGHLVAVVADAPYGDGLEVTAAYDNGTPEGKVAVVALCLGYQEMLKSGDVSCILFQVLYRNKDFWKALKRETGADPEVLTYVLRRPA